MKIFEITEGERHGNDSTYDKCWTGYRKVPGKKRGEKGSCVKEETGPSGADMLAKVDMLLQNTGIKRKGFKLVRDPAAQGSVRGSITSEALAMIKNVLAKAQAMSATEPSEVEPTMNPADVPNSAFTEAGDLRSTIDAYKQSFIKKTPPESWLPDETYREQLDNAIKKYGNNAKKLVAYIRSDNDFMLWFAKLPERDYLKKDGMAIIRPTVSETATAGSTSSGNMATVANPISANAKIKRDKNGVPMAPQKKNADGTAKNALELSNNLMGGKAIKR